MPKIRKKDEKNTLRKEAHHRMATDEGEEDNEDGGEQHWRTLVVERSHRQHAAPQV